MGSNGLAVPAMPALSSKELLEAQSRLWNHMLSFINSFALKSAVDLRIPDAVYHHDKPITLVDLAAALSIPPCRIPSFHRLMNLLVHNGYFKRAVVNGNNEETYSLTPSSQILVRGSGESMSPLIDMFLYQPILDSWQKLGEWFRCEQPPTAFEMHHGSFIWDLTASKPELLQVTRDGLECDSSAVVARVLTEDCAHLFRGVESVAELCGNTGMISQGIKKAFPHINCTVIELPHVIDTIKDKGGVQYSVGDIFKHVPSADMLIMKWVLMTFSDEECVQILKRCKEAIPTKENGGKAIVIDIVMGVTGDGVHAELAETQLYFDMWMLAPLTGKQRTEKEWSKLFVEAGFKEYKITPAFGMRCVIEIYH